MRSDRHRWNDRPISKDLLFLHATTLCCMHGQSSLVVTISLQSSMCVFFHSPPAHSRVTQQFQSFEFKHTCTPEITSVSAVVQPDLIYTYAYQPALPLNHSDELLDTAQARWTRCAGVQ